MAANARETRSRSNEPARRRSGSPRSALARCRHSRSAPGHDGANHAQVAHHRGQRPQPPAQLFPIAAARQQLRTIEPAARIARPRHLLQHLGRGLARLDEGRRSTVERQPKAAVGCRGGRMRVGGRVVVRASSARPRCRPATAVRIAAAGSATAPSAAARRAAPSRARTSMPRRLLERLEQRVLRFGHHRVRFVDDDDSAAALERPVAVRSITSRT